MSYQLPSDDKHLAPWLSELFSLFNFVGATWSEDIQRRVESLRLCWENFDWQDLEYQAKYLVLDDRRRLFEGIERRQTTPTRRAIVEDLHRKLGWLALCRVNAEVRKGPERVAISSVANLFRHMRREEVWRARRLFDAILSLIEASCLPMLTLGDA